MFMYVYVYLYFIHLAYLQCLVILYYCLLIQSCRRDPYIVKILHNTVLHSFQPGILFFLEEKILRGNSIKLRMNKAQTFLKQSYSGKWQDGDLSTNLRHYQRELKSNQLRSRQTKNSLITGHLHFVRHFKNVKTTFLKSRLYRWTQSKMLRNKHVVLTFVILGAFLPHCHSREPPTQTITCLIIITMSLSLHQN